MQIKALGYVGVRATDLDGWRNYATGLLGMQLVDRSQSTLAFRMDDRSQRLVVAGDNANGPGFYGWEVENADALAQLAGRLEAHGVRVRRMPKAHADERHVAEVIAFEDPVGNRLEAFYGPHLATEPFMPGRCISGFRTGPLGMGHAVITVERVEDVLPFYKDVLGFQLSDYALRPFPAYFFHLNPRHHSFAIVGVGKNGLHHLMMELYSLDDVGQAYDLANDEEGRVSVTLGRHTNDFMTSFYSYTPSGFMVEYGWGGRAIDPGTWTPSELQHGPSMWGHERHWLPPEGRAEARAMRLRAAAQGVRQPVQVIAGNHELMPGTCPWWDAARRSG